jgi:hypothetical protein
MNDWGRGTAGNKNVQWSNVKRSTIETKITKHTELIPQIQKTGPGLSLSARKNPSNPKDGFGFMGVACGGAGADAKVLNNFER